VSQWFFEVWNEPNLDVFGSGKQKDYFKLYGSTVKTIKGVDSSLKVGGPATAKSAWIEEFVASIEKHKLPADFISTHQYPTDAFGSPGDDTETQLAKGKRGVMKEKAQDARRQAGERPLYYTEWSTSSNPRDRLHDEPFAAAFATNIMLSVDGVVDGYSWWTFSDIFNENYMPSLPFQGGFGLLNIHNIAKPVYRAFELLHRLGTKQLMVDGLHDTVTAWVVRSDGNSATVLLTNHSLPRHSIKTELVQLKLTDAPRPLAAYLERVDDAHANATRVWREMNEPEYLSHAQVEQLQAASQLVKEPLSVKYQEQEQELSLEVDLMPHAIAAVTIEFSPGQPKQSESSARAGKKKKKNR
jgi:xylan 1,4-beta-xylosidase